LSLSQINPIHAHTPFLEDPFLILSSDLSLGLESGLCTSGFPNKTLYAFLFTLTHATRLLHHVLLNLINRKIFSKEYQIMKLFIMQSFPFLWYLGPLRPKNLSQHPILEHNQSMVFPECEKPSFKTIQKTGKIVVTE
jgi:hypothetical protein